MQQCTCPGFVTLILNSLDPRFTSVPFFMSAIGRGGDEMFLRNPLELDLSIFGIYFDILFSYHTIFKWNRNYKLMIN